MLCYCFATALLLVFRGDNSLDILVIFLMYKLLHPNRYALLLLGVAMLLVYEALSY
jgi:hypothetical protein